MFCYITCWIGEVLLETLIRSLILNQLINRQYTRDSSYISPLYSLLFGQYPSIRSRELSANRILSFSHENEVRRPKNARFFLILWIDFQLDVVYGRGSWSNLLYTKIHIISSHNVSFYSFFTLFFLFRLRISRAKKANNCSSGLGECIFFWDIIKKPFVKIAFLGNQLMFRVFEV